MIAYLVGTLFLFFMVGGGQTYLMEPETLYDWAMIPPPPLSCRPLTTSERQMEGFPPRGKATTFNLEPKAVCEKQLFAYGERDSFYDFLIKNGPPNARQIGSHLPSLEKKLQEMGWIPQSGIQWSLEILTTDLAVKNYVESLLQVELSQSTTGSISRQPGNPLSPMRLKVMVQSTIIPEDLLKVEAEVLHRGERRSWKI